MSAYSGTVQGMNMTAQLGEEVGYPISALKHAPARSSKGQDSLVVISVCVPMNTCSKHPEFPLQVYIGCVDIAGCG